MPRATSAIVFIAVVAGVSVGCGPKTASDQSIITDIQSKLYADAVTKPASIAVAAQNGVVTLSGDVPSSDVALEAMKIANGTSGVRSVNDQITINGQSATAQLPNAGTATPALAASNPPVASPAPTAPVAASAPPPYASPAPAQSGAAMPPEPRRPPEPVIITIPAGARLQVRTIDAINSANADSGQLYRASLDAPLVHEGRVIVPAGVPVSLVVVAARSAGRIKGSSELEVRASGLEYHGRNLPLDTSVFAEEGKARGKGTAVRTGIGAVAGAVIGGIAGGGKGAAIGSAAGGGAGFGSALFTHGQQVKIPSESVLTFRLEAPLRLER
ncbi:MAG: BON domain-containing protein [Acidobacteriaceae bacterium]|nr:BON domain-containing protein [Acidobacteriaceae bacterium]